MPCSASTLTDPVTRLAGAAGRLDEPGRRGSPPSAADTGSGMAARRTGLPPFTAIRVDGGAPAIASGAIRRAPA